MSLLVMANTHLNDAILEHIGGNLANNLNEVMRNFDDLDFDISTISQSPYFTTNSIKSFTAENIELFTVMTLNAESIISKFEALKCLLCILRENNFTPSAICIQETWLPQNYEHNSLHIPGYDIIQQGRPCSKKGGLMIYLKDTFTYKVRNIHAPFEKWEHQFIDVFNENMKNKITIGNIYRPPRSNNNNAVIQTFIEKISPIIKMLSSEKNNCFIAGDFNINLLEINQRNKYHEYLDLLTTNGFYPSIIHPTRF